MDEQVKDKRFISLTTRFLVVFTLGVVLPLIITGVVQFAINYSTQNLQVENLQSRAAESVATTIDAYLAQFEGEMTLLSSARFSQAGESPDELLEGLLVYDAGFELLTLMDGTGQELAKKSHLEVLSSDDLGNRADSAEFAAASRGERYLGPIFESQYGEPWVTLAIPVQDVYGNVEYVFSADVNLKYMWDAIEEVEVGSEGYAYVVDGEGRLIAHRDSSLVLQWRDLNDVAGIRSALQGEAITDSYIGLEEQRVVGSYLPLEQTDWFVLVETPTSEALKYVYWSAGISGVAIVVALGLASWLGLYLVRTVVQPLKQLQKSVAIIGDGDLSYRVDIQTQDEIGVLGDAFNDMAARLEEIVAISEKRETERLQMQEQIIEAQTEALKELSSPIIPVMDRIIIVPLVGNIGDDRAVDITRSLLAGIRQHRAKVVILDITGVPVVDSAVANHLYKTIQAARLKGARTIITGISDVVAETIIDLGIDWGDIDTVRDLRTGLVSALNSLGIQLSK
ncbi:MAG: HAMP domain-containing protein [Chloroflexi bacterium]|nr:HAMP domain-containing protein [Chloroflexota bacterium]